MKHEKINNNPVNQSSKFWKLQRPMFIFYFLVAYIFASFVWWSYLLIKNSNTLFELQKARMEHSVSDDPAINNQNLLIMQEMEKDHNRQMYMIVGEGIVFFTLLGIAVWRIRRSFRQEMTLARQQHNFMLSITHELKSPLASIRLGIETLLKRDLDIHKTRQILVNSVSDVDRLQALVDDILIAAKFEGHTYEFSRAKVDFSALVAQTVTRLSEMQGRDHNISSKITQGLMVNGDRQSLVSLVSNLVDNAIKYTPIGGRINITLKQQNKIICLEVADSGIGIPEEEKSDVFKKFYRVGYEDTRQSNGAGLGLFIVKEVLNGHGGTCTIKNNKPKGSIFIITLNAVPADS